MTNQCPFCGNYAYAVSVGAAYRLDCRYCEIQIEITKRAYAARCPNPVAVLDYIKEKMKASVRPWVDIADMKRSTLMPPTPSLTIEDEPIMSESKKKKTPEADDDLLVTAAKAIGSTLGKMAVKSGIAKPAEPAVRARKKASPKTKTVAKKAVKKAASAAKPKRSK